MFMGCPYSRVGSMLFGRYMQGDAGHAQCAALQFIKPLLDLGAGVVGFTAGFEGRDEYGYFLALLELWKRLLAECCLGFLE